MEKATISQLKNRLSAYLRKVEHRPAPMRGYGLVRKQVIEDAISQAYTARPIKLLKGTSY